MLWLAAVRMRETHVTSPAVLSCPRGSESIEAMVELSTREREILAFEREWWKHASAKDTALRERLAMTPQTYYRSLNEIIDQPAALAHDPLLVRRLRRQRISRRRQRRASRLNGWLG